MDQSLYFNESIEYWVRASHIKMSELYKMKPIRIKTNDFGYDSYACILIQILSNASSTDIMNFIRNELDITKYIELSHSAWSKNYIHWKSIHDDNTLSSNPKKTLNTIRRNNVATTSSISHLDSDDLELYTDIINVVFSILGEKVLNAGMQQLSI